MTWSSTWISLLGCSLVACAEPTPTAPPELAAPEHAPELAAPELAAPELATVEPARPYDRSTWKHWIDEDQDCQDTRTEVLIAESFGPIELEGPRGCEVESGEWQCPYTGEIIRDAHLLDVDHLVPLANAHRSGAAAWDDDRRRAYANDLDHAEHLVAVEFGANRSKGDDGPEAWLPPAEESRCGYVRDWVAIKTRWQLDMSDAEASAIAAAQRDCESGQIPELPDKPAAEKTSRPAKSITPSTSEPSIDTPRKPGECCKVCKKGKACGDTCVARDSTCTATPGCACDG
ncbi:GmrSD restriction endonuclease domain-containing protein [Nannocystaceae bacterium ST9]